jgi:hypothetical protein
MKSDRPVLRVKRPTPPERSPNERREEAAGWIGCGECDSSFPCHEGAARCTRLPAKPVLGVALARRVALSDLYYILAAEERAECDELLRLGGAL